VCVYVMCDVCVSETASVHYTITCIDFLHTHTHTHTHTHIHTYTHIHRNIPFFKTLSRSAVNVMCAEMKLEDFSIGETVFKQGDFGDKLYLIADGSVQVMILLLLYG